MPMGYKFTKSQKKINNLMYMDDIKLFAKKKKKKEKNEKESKTVIQTIVMYSQDIGMEIGIEK